MMDILVLDQELRSNKVRPCYLLVGDEPHLLLTARQHILKAIFKEAQAAPDRFSARQTPLAAVFNALKTPSMFSPWQCVLVEEAEILKKKDWDDLKNALQRPPEKATLILLASGGHAPSKLPPVVGTVECKKLYPNQIVPWINIEAKDLGCPISREAALFLAECVGNDLGSLRQRLEMLTLYVGSRCLIGLEDVEALASKTAQKNIFELTNAVGEKNRPRAEKFLTLILEQGEEPLKVLALISRHMRLLAQAKEIVQAAGGSIPPDFAGQLGVHPFFAKEYAVQSKKWPAQWKRCFSALQTCDAALKSSRHKPQAVLEKLIRQLCR